MADVVVPDVVDGDIPPVPDKVRSSMLHIEDEAPLVIKDDIDIVLGGDDHPEINETDPVIISSINQSFTVMNKSFINV
jgi:hypothetical protein